MEIYTAAISPRGVACSAEVADGVIPVWMNPERFDLLAPHLEEGFEKAVTLLGPRERIRDRLEAWKASPVRTMLVGSGQPEALRLLAENLL